MVQYIINLFRRKKTKEDQIEPKKEPEQETVRKGPDAIFSFFFYNDGRKQLFLDCSHIDDQFPKIFADFLYNLNNGQYFDAILQTLMNNCSEETQQKIVLEILYELQNIEDVELNSPAVSPLDFAKPS